MAATAPLENLESCKDDLERFRKLNPEGYKTMEIILKSHHGIGYKNSARLAMGSTPEELKE